MVPKHGWDPRHFGCRCDVCPLGPDGFIRDKSKPWAPVPGSCHKVDRGGVTTVAIGQIPADDETELGYPFAGRSGLKWNDLLRRIGKSREDVDLDNVASCQPPGEASGAWERMLVTIKDENDRLEVEGSEFRWPNPADCCAPRLRWILTRYRDVIALGGTAASVIMGTTKGIMTIRGGPREVPVVDEAGAVVRTLRVMPTLHPAYVLRPGTAQWEEALESDLAKAFRWFEGRRDWIEPHYTWRPTAEELYAWLAAPARFTVFDYETSMDDPLEARVDCIGFGVVLDEPVEVPCEKCAGTGRRVLSFDPSVGWQPSLPEHRGEPCLACGGRLRRYIRTRGVVVPLHSRETGERFYSPAEEEQVKAVLRGFFTSPHRWKVGHNASNFDQMVTEQWLGVSVEPLLDTMALARARAPDMPKGLGIVGSLFTDIHAWKADADGQKQAETQNDAQLHYYNLLDCCVNAQITDALVRIASERGYFAPLPDHLRHLMPAAWFERYDWTLAGIDRFRQKEVANGIHYNGMYVDHAKREEHERALTAEIRKWRKRTEEYAAGLGLTGPVKSKKRGPEPFNIGSDKQLGHIIYTVWGVIPKPDEKSEKTGRPSTKDAVLRRIYTSNELQHADGCKRDAEGNVKSGDCALDCRFGFLDAARRYRRARKAKSTFVMSLRQRPPDPTERRKLRERKGSKSSLPEDKRWGMTWEDGRVRPSVSAIMVSVSRLAVKQPGLQQQPVQYRDMLCAAPIYPPDDSRWPGRVQIGGDVDQFHLRIIANVWRIQRLLEAFHYGLDPHNMLAYDFFGQEFVHAPGWGPDGFSLKKKPIDKKSLASKMRDMAKIIRYQGAYADTPEGIHQSVIKVEDKKTGDLPFKDVSLRDVKKRYRIWMRAEPEWRQAWDAAMNRYNANGGCGVEPVFGRRSGSLEQGKKQAVVNWEILAAEPSLTAIIEARVLDAFPTGKWGPGTGLVAQTHDAINVEVPGFAWEELRGEKVVIASDEQTERFRAQLEECMNITVPGWPVPITSTAQIGPVRVLERDAKGKPIPGRYRAQLSNWMQA